MFHNMMVLCHYMMVLCYYMMILWSLYDGTLLLYDGTLSLYDGTLPLYDDTLSLFDDTSFKHVFRKTKWLFQFFSNTLYVQEIIKKFCWQIIFFILSNKTESNNIFQGILWYETP